jgi:peptidyl-Lys metalloendopeptidase
MHLLRRRCPERTVTRKDLWKLLLAIGVAAFGASTAAAQSFTAELSSRKVAYGATEPIELHLNIRNVSSGELALLSWKLPFAGIKDDIFVVTCGGKRAPYIGRLYKRAAPTAADWIRIPPGKELSGTFDLAGSYAIDEGGDCTVRFQFKLANVLAKGRDTVAGTVSSEPLSIILDPRPTPKEVAIQGPLAVIAEEAAAEEPLALSQEEEAAAAEELLALSPEEEAAADHPLALSPEEELAAAEELLALLQEEAAVEEPLALSPEEEAAAAEEPFARLPEGAAVAEPLALRAAYRFCSATRQTLLKKALASAQTYATGAYKFLVTYPRSTTRYTRWFGRFTTTRYKIVKGSYYRMKNAMASKRFTFDCSCNEAGAFAYVYPTRPYQVWLCPLFWRVRNSGRDSKAGTLVHETSHFDRIGNTDDYVYGVYASRWLAIYYPSYAVFNADNYEYFVELK